MNRGSGPVGPHGYTGVRSGPQWEPQRAPPGRGMPGPAMLGPHATGRPHSPTNMRGSGFTGGPVRGEFAGVGAAGMEFGHSGLFGSAVAGIRAETPGSDGGFRSGADKRPRPDWHDEAPPARRGPSGFGGVGQPISPRGMSGHPGGAGGAWGVSSNQTLGAPLRGNSREHGSGGSWMDGVPPHRRGGAGAVGPGASSFGAVAVRGGLQQQQQPGGHDLGWNSPSDGRLGYDGGMRGNSAGGGFSGSSGAGMHHDAEVHVAMHNGSHDMQRMEHMREAQAVRGHGMQHGMDNRLDSTDIGNIDEQEWYYTDPQVQPQTLQCTEESVLCMIVVMIKSCVRIFYLRLVLKAAFWKLISTIVQIVWTVGNDTGTLQHHGVPWVAHNSQHGP